MIIQSVPSGGESSPRKSTGRWKILAVIVAIIAVAALSEVLSYYFPESTAPGPYVVTVQIPNGAAVNSSLNFSPATLNLVVGINNTVQWIDLDKTPNAFYMVTFAQVPANVTATSFSSTTNIGYDIYFGPELFPIPGIYHYQCSCHSWMKGTIVVKP